VRPFTSPRRGPSTGSDHCSGTENATLNLCLYLDRCGDALTVGPSVRLDQMDGGELLRLVAPYRIVLEF
jgi:hypothetical protein